MTSYDEVPYPSFPYPESHPDRLATLATLFGMQPAPVDRCRVLELGCASGGNLIPMAEGLPESTFVGIDLSARQIAAGGGVIKGLGLGNITLRHLDLVDLPADLGTFDYIIAHGLFSWVESPVQDRLLDICREQLAPQGVAYVSYNTYPGWHTRGLVRDLLLYHTCRVKEPKARVEQSRAFLAFLAQSVPAEIAPYRQLLQEEQRKLQEKPDGYFLHDELEEVNDPVYFHDFAELAADKGLQYLAEAETSSLMPGRFPPEAMAALNRFGGDLLEREQYFDFLTNRMVRRTLLCHQEVTLIRDLKPEQVGAFQIASRASCLSSAPDIRSGKPEEFQGPSGVTIGTDHPLTKAAFVYLASIWPRCLSLEALRSEARASLETVPFTLQDLSTQARDTQLLAENLLQGYTAGVVEFHLYPSPLAASAGARPRASAHARLQAGQGNRITNLRHAVVPLDEVSCHLLRHLDGSRDHAALAEILYRLVAEKGMVVQKHGKPITDPSQVRAVLAEGVDTNLILLTQLALVLK